MDTPIVMLLNVVLWSFGISAAILVGLIWLDGLSARGGDAVEGLPSGAGATVARLPQSEAARRSANEAAAKAA
jgi:hypothetical protein